MNKRDWSRRDIQPGAYSMYMSAILPKAYPMPLLVDAMEAILIRDALEAYETSFSFHPPETQQDFVHDREIIRTMREVRQRIVDLYA